LFLAFKEALNNAVKHSRATQVALGIKIADGAMHLAISDNGGGFAAGSPPAGGDGLNNMRSRLTHLGGRCDIAGVPGAGVCVTFIIPLRDGPAPAPLAGSKSL